MQSLKSIFTDPHTYVIALAVIVGAVKAAEPFLSTGVVATLEGLLGIAAIYIHQNS